MSRLVVDPMPDIAAQVALLRAHPCPVCKVVDVDEREVERGGDRDGLVGATCACNERWDLTAIAREVGLRVRAIDGPGLRGA